MSVSAIWANEARDAVRQFWSRAGVEVPPEFGPVVDQLTILVAEWMDTAAQHHRNEEYYRGIVVRCGELIGPETHISDDGTDQKEVLCAGVLDHLERVMEELAEARGEHTGRPL